MFKQAINETNRENCGQDADLGLDSLSVLGLVIDLGLAGLVLASICMKLQSWEAALI